MKKNITGKPLWFEQEVNVWDNEKRPINYIDGWAWVKLIMSNEILKALRANPKYQKLINKNGGRHIAKAELDASQIELYNPLPKMSVKRLQEELYETYVLIEDIVQWFGYRLIDQVVPDSNFDPVHSWAEDRYQYIHDKLSSISTDARKATNITWTHLTYDAWKDMINHIAVSQYVRNCLLRDDYKALSADPTRIERYKCVVDALEMLDFVNSWYLPQDIHSVDDVRKLQLDTDWNDRFGYELVRKKSATTGTGLWAQKQHLSELRVVDGPVSADDVIMQTDNALRILEESLLSYTS